MAAHLPMDTQVHHMYDNKTTISQRKMRAGIYIYH